MNTRQGPGKDNQKGADSSDTTDASKMAMEEASAENENSARSDQDPGLNPSQENTKNLFLIRQLETRIRDIEGRLKDANDRIRDYETKTADIREYVKRMETEVVQIRERSEREIERTSNRKFCELFQNLLPVIDNFELSVKSAQSEKSALASGVLLIHQQFQNFLKQMGLERIPSIGEEFDPLLHDAIATQPIKDPAMEGRVLEELKAGYKYKDTVVRPAQVVVGSKSG